MIRYTNITTASMDYVAYYLYVGEGLLLMVLNIPIAFIIFATPNLRIQKEFIIFAFSMIFDAIFGFSYLYCGVFRLIFYYNEKCKISLFQSQNIRFWTSPGWLLTHSYTSNSDSIYFQTYLSGRVGCVSILRWTMALFL